MARKNTNPKVPGCHGFAEFRIVGGKREAHWTGKVELIEEKLLEPLSWRRKALKFREQHGRKPRAFISMSDLFHENLPDEAIDQVFAVAALTPEINYMFLTKRAERMADYFSGEWLAGRLLCQTTAIIEDHVDPLSRRSDDLRARCQTWEEDEPLPNVALGVSVESPKYLYRVAHLLRTPAAMRFVSYEPALEAVDFTSIEWPNKNGHRVDALRAGYWNEDGYVAFGPSAKLGEARGGFTNHSDMNVLDMIIVGGESGPGARPFDIAWARKTVEQCREAGTACFVKQMGSNPVAMMSINAALELYRFAGRNPDKLEPLSFRDRKGEDMSEWPEELRVRQWPEGWN
jgi:protein gp37